MTPSRETPRRLFDDSDTPMNAPCYEDLRQQENRSIQAYTLFGGHGCSSMTAVNEFAVAHNFTVTNGYGNVNKCDIDRDSELVQGSMNRSKDRQQLIARWDLAGPDMGRGVFVPAVDSRLKLPDDTSELRSCDPLGEKDYRRFYPYALRPVNPCENAQDPARIIMPGPRYGQMGRDV